MVKVDIKDLIKLKEQGKSYEEISEYYKTQGIQISRSTVGNRLKPYYESAGKKVPNSKTKINIPIEELVELKEQGLSNDKIAEHYKSKGVQISGITVGRILKAHYESEGKKVPRVKITREPQINIPIEELVELKEQGLSNEKIVEYYKSKGIQITGITVGKRLKAHYESEGKKVPRGKITREPQIKIPIEELVELKEQGLSNNKISEYYKLKGVQITGATVARRLKEHYESEGTKVPNSKTKINIPIEELVELKEQGKTYEQISEFYKKKGIQISISAVGKRIKDHYQSEGKEVSRVKRVGKPRINIGIEELVELKEQGMSNDKIAEYYKSKGVQITGITVGRRIKAHYESEGKIAPRGKITREPQINIPIEELVELKEKGLSNEKISEYYEIKDIKISTITVGKRLRAYYESKGEKVPRSSSSDIDKVKAEELIRLKDKGKTLQQISGYYKRRGIKISSNAISKKIKEYKFAKAKEKREKLDAELKTIILNGETVRVYCQRNKCPEKEEQLKERIRRLKIIASKARKQGEYYIEDKEFLEVLNILENSMMLYPANKYSVYINPYIANGICRNGNIDLIQMRVFKRNKDLMCYILSAFKFRYAEEYDKKVYERLKQEHEAKIDKYIGRLHAVEEKRSKTTQKKSKNAKVPQDDDDQR